MAFVVLRQICFLFNFNLVEIWSFRANSTVGLRKPKAAPPLAEDVRLNGGARGPSKIGRRRVAFGGFPLCLPAFLTLTGEAERSLF